jgi:hypothetical protein
MASGAHNPAAPPVVRDLTMGGSGGTRTRDLVANNGMRDGRVTRDVAPSVDHSPTVDRGGRDATVIRPGNGSATRSGGGSRIDRSGGDIARGSEASRMVREGRTSRTIARATSPAARSGARPAPGFRSAATPAAPACAGSAALWIARSAASRAMSSRATAGR